MGEIENPRKKWPDVYKRSDSNYRKKHSAKVKDYAKWYYENVTKPKREASKAAQKARKAS